LAQHHASGDRRCEAETDGLGAGVAPLSGHEASFRQGRADSGNLKDQETVGLRREEIDE